MTSAIQSGASLQQASIRFDGETLTAATGALTRVWRWTGHGFLTQSVSLDSGREWRLPHEDERDADWLLPVCEDTNPAASLASVDIRVDDDEGFTSEHVCCVAEMVYPDARLALRFIVWAYPDAPGIRTALQIKGLDGYSWDADRFRREVGDEALRIARLTRGYRRNEMLPLDFAGASRRLFGYYSDTQNRNDTHLDLLQEVVDERPLTHPAEATWANAIGIEDGEWGIALLKESHKCVNQHGHDTGLFLCLPGRGVESHGWGILPGEIDGQWRPAWATWCIAYNTDDRARQKAFKTFDRLRYPVAPEDIPLQSNTWGSSQGWLEHRIAAGEANVLVEIDSAADLGLDVLQIDDGWQGDTYEQWRPSPERYPAGWSNVRKHAAEKGVRLGLWLSSPDSDLEDLRVNAAEGGFVSYKLDFAFLNSRAKIDELMTRAREFIKSQSHSVRINWDLTEVSPRYGFYFGREFGSIYLENRKPVVPASTTYRPSNVLRDLWQLSRYCNLLKFQGSVQNIDLVNPLYSNAAAFEQDYCLAIALMSSPLFFGETRHFPEAVRAKLRPLIAAYKSVRDDISRGTVYPVGEKPDGTRWTGFDCEMPEGNRGFLMVFREPWNDSDSGVFRLPHLAGKTVALENLMDGETRTTTIAEDGGVALDIESPGAYRFLRYEAV